MKQAILTFDKSEILLVELPEGANTVKVYNPFGRYFHISCYLPSEPGFKKAFGSYFPFKFFGGRKKYPYDIKLIGKLSELTETTFMKLVDLDGRLGWYYKNYEGGTPYAIARQSFFSKLSADGYYTFHPDGEGPDYTGDANVDKALMEDWEMTQERVFRPERTFLFKILKQPK